MSNKSKQIQRLQLVVKIMTAMTAMTAMTVLAFVYVLLAGMFGGHGMKQTDNDLSTIGDNQTVMRSIKGKRVWVTKFAGQLLSKRKLTDNLVIDKNKGCDIAKSLCLISAETDRIGVEIRYVETIPPQLPNDTFWIGGYVNPVNGAVYDRFGRGYKMNMPSAEKQLIMSYPK